MSVRQEEIFYEWVKNPAETKLESQETFQRYSGQLIQLQAKIENEKLPHDKIKAIVKTVKNN